MIEYELHIIFEDEKWQLTTIFSALLGNQFTNSGHEDSPRNIASTRPELRRASFIYPDPEAERDILEKSFNKEVSDIPLRRLISHRLLVLTLMLALFLVGILCKIFIPVESFRGFSSNETTAVPSLK